MDALARISETIQLPARAFKDVLARDALLRDRVHATILDRLSSQVQRQEEPEPGNVVEFLVRQGLGEGTDVLLIDASLCVGCDNGEKASADTHHGTARRDSIVRPDRRLRMCTCPRRADTASIRIA